MAKGQIKGDKEAKKPKASKDQPKGPGSPYKQAQGNGIPTASPFAKNDGLKRKPG